MVCEASLSFTIRCASSNATVAKSYFRETCSALGIVVAGLLDHSCLFGPARAVWRQLEQGGLPFV